VRRIRRVGDRSAERTTCRQATLVVYELRRRGLGAFPDWLAREHIGAFVAVPTVLREALGAAPADQVFPDLRTALLNGEAMTWEDAERLRRHLSAEASVLNLYGTTETGFLTVTPITGDTPIGAGRMPVGYPLPDGPCASLTTRVAPYPTAKWARSWWRTPGRPGIGKGQRRPPRCLDAPSPA